MSSGEDKIKIKIYHGFCFLKRILLIKEGFTVGEKISQFKYFLFRFF